MSLSLLNLLFLRADTEGDGAGCGTPPPPPSPPQPGKSQVAIGFSRNNRSDPLEKLLEGDSYGPLGNTLMTKKTLP